MANIRLITPSNPAYPAAHPVTSNISGLSSWLRISTDIPNPDLHELSEALSALQKENIVIMPIEAAIGADPYGKDSTHLFVVSTSSQHFGASIILNPNTIPAIQKTLHCKSFVLIPSSVHELLALQYDNPWINLDDLADMIRSINSTEVEAEDVLDNVPWVFSGGSISRYDRTPQKQPLTMHVPAFAST